MSPAAPFYERLQQRCVSEDHTGNIRVLGQTPVSRAASISKTSKSIYPIIISWLLIDCSFNKRSFTEYSYLRAQRKE